MHPDSILIPDGRQRKDLGDLAELCTSISATGLIHPIVIDGDDMSLIAGERRLSAMKMLGFEELVENEHYRIVFPDSDLHRHAIELEENIRRQDMTPAEAGHAVKEYH